MIEPRLSVAVRIGYGGSPPAFAVAAALAHANASPCQKSKRGVVLYKTFGHPDPGYHLAEFAPAWWGFNGPPVTAFARGWTDPAHCDGSEACRASCSKRCVHAEQRAILCGGTTEHTPMSILTLVHVKADAYGQLVAGKGPSCVDCSKLILDCGVCGVWLYEDRYDGLGSGEGRAAWRYYPAAEFHALSEQACGIYQIKR